MFRIKCQIPNTSMVRLLNSDVAVWCDAHVYICFYVHYYMYVAHVVFLVTVKIKQKYFQFTCRGPYQIEIKP